MRAGNRSELVRRAAAPILVALLLGALLAAVVRSQDPRAREYQLHDAGVWVSRADESQVGRFNSAVEELDARPDAGAREFELLQSDGDVLVETEHEVTPIDVRDPNVPGQPIPVPPDGEVRLNRGVISVLDRRLGDLWVRAASSLAAGTYVGAKRTAPTLRLGPDARSVVGVDGTVHAFSPKTGELVSVAPSGETARRALATTPGPRDVVQLTAVGSIGVLLDVTSGRIATTDGTEARVPVGRDAQVQWPGEASDAVMVAQGHEVLVVDLGTGRSSTLGSKSVGADPIPPAVIDGCAYLAWQSDASFALVCTDPARSTPVYDMAGLDGASAHLVWRINRGVAVLNEADTGIVVHIRQDGSVVQINPRDWQRLDPNSKVNDDPSPPQADDACGTGAEQRPTAKDDDGFGTRRGRSVTIPVLDNDSDENRCDVLAVTDVSVPAGMGSAAVTSSGQAIQYTPPPASGLRSARFAYTVSDGRRTDEAQVTVDLFDQVEDTPPRLVRDKATTKVSTAAVRRTVTRNVLLNDTDAEGDPLSLVGAKASCGTDCIDWSQDGTVTVTIGDQPGPIDVTYTASDGHNGGRSGGGALTISVADAATHVKPDVYPEVVFTTVDRPAKIDVAANDFPGSGTQELRVVDPVAPAGLRVETQDPSTLSVEGHEAGTYLVKYRIYDGEEQSDVVRLRVDVLEPSDENHAPVATDDVSHLAPDGPIEASVLDNDYDADRDVLVLTGLSGEVPPGLHVAIVDNAVLRIAADPDFAGPARVAYVVSDGRSSSTGSINVQPPVAPKENRSPTAVADRVRVRVGNVVTIPVLANDHDPERDRLSVTSVVDPSGSAFFAGNLVKFQAPTRPGIVTLGYGIEDPYKNPATGKITIEVLADDGRGNKTTNTAPNPPDVVARAFVGQTVPIKLPISGADPEGDPVVVTGIDQPPVAGAIVDFDGRTFTYQAPDQPEAAGTVRFTYNIQDVFGASDTGVVLVGVAPRLGLNRAPVTFDDTVRARPGRSIRLDPTGNDVDPDGDPLEVLRTGANAPRYQRTDGAALAFLDDRILRFTVPDLPDGTSVPIDYTVGDVGEGHAVAGRVTVIVDRAAPNHPPVARDDYQVPGSSIDRPVDVPVLDNDFDPDLDRLRIEAPNVRGVRVVDGRLQVDLGRTSRSFKYTITDGQSDHAEASAFVVIPVVASQPPVVPTATGTMERNGVASFPVLEQAFDRDGDKLELTGAPASREGQARYDGGAKIEFRPARGFVGRAAVTFHVTAGADTVTGTLLVTVTGETARKPELTATAIDVHAGGTAPLVELAGHVANGSPTQEFEIVSGPTSGDLSVSLVDGHILRVSAKARARRITDGVRVTVRTRAGTSAPALFPINVLSSDKPKMSVSPQVLTDWRNRQGPRTIALTDNVFDPTQTAGGSGPVVKRATLTAGEGSVSVASGAAPKGIVYRPPPDAQWGGPVRISFVLGDSTGDDSRNVTSTVEFLVNGVPRAPQILGADPGDQQLTVRFALSSARGADIDRYDVTNAPGSPAAKVSCSAVQASQCVVSGLQNAQEYRLQIVAHTKQGDTSEPGTGGPYIPDVLPEVPQVATVDFDDATLIVTAAKLVSHGSRVDKVEIGYSLGAGQAIPSVTVPGVAGSPDQVTVVQPGISSGITNGTTYFVRLRAHNKAVTDTGGWTEWGPEAQITPYGPAAASGIPVPEVTVGDESMSVSWVSMATGDAGGDPNPRYLLRLVKDDAVVPDNDAVPDTSPATVATDNIAKYHFYLQVLNKYTDRYPAKPNPDGPRSDEYQSFGVPKKANGKPGASVGHDSGKATLALPGCDATCQNGSPITKWQYRANGGGTSDLEPGNKGSSPNGTATTFEVFPCNQAGCSTTPSDPSDQVTPFGPPSVSFNGSGITSGPKAYWDWTVNWNGRSGSQTVNGAGVNNHAEVGAQPGDNRSITVVVNNGFDTGPVSAGSPNVYYAPLSISVSLVPYVGVRSDGSAGSDRDDRVTFNTPGGPLGNCRIYDGGSLIFNFPCGAPGNAVFPYRYSTFTTPDLSPGVHSWTIEADDRYGGTTRASAQVTACYPSGGTPRC